MPAAEQCDKNAGDGGVLSHDGLGDLAADRRQCGTRPVGLELMIGWCRHSTGRTSFKGGQIGGKGDEAVVGDRQRSSEQGEHRGVVAPGGSRDCRDDILDGGVARDAESARDGSQGVVRSWSAAREASPDA